VHRDSSALQKWFSLRTSTYFPKATDDGIVFETEKERIANRIRMLDYEAGEDGHNAATEPSEAAMLVEATRNARKKLLGGLFGSS